MTQADQQTKQHILIVAQPGPLGDGLVALLSALPQVGQVLQTHELEAALHLAATWRPQLIIVDLNSPEDSVLTLLHALRSPDSRCLVLAENVGQKKAVEESGAGTVILKGTAATEMITLVERLLEINSNLEVNK